MASAFAHAVIATALGKTILPRESPRWTWALGAVLAAVPDLDVVGFHFGIRYGDTFGHRGFTHSFFFAAVVAAFLAVALQRRPRVSGRRLFGFFFLALASHGLADALTNGGLGIAFFAPFSNARYFFPFRPVAVSPIGLERFFSSRGGAVLRSEAIWLVLPSLVVFAAATIARGIERERRTGGTRKSGGL